MNSLTDCKILMVDDEEDFLATMVKYMRRKKISVSTAGTGEAGIAWLMENPVDVVVLDIKLPDMSGLDVLRVMREKKGTDFEIIILSGHAHTDIALEAMKSGASDFLLKPCAVDDLLERIDSVYERLLERRMA
jgi:DNA-binding response OmpR family regulator